MHMQMSLHSAQEEVFKCLLGHIACSGLIAPPNNRILCLKGLSRVEVERPCPPPSFQEVVEDVNIGCNPVALPGKASNLDKLSSG